MVDSSIAHFWDKYILKTKIYGIKQHKSYWYVRHAEAYIKSFNGVRLSHHTEQHLESYLKEKYGSPRYQGWQLRQMLLSLEILFKEMINPSWAVNFNWQKWRIRADDREAEAVDPATHNIDAEFIHRQLSDKNPRTASLFSQVFEKYPGYISDLITQIRIKHYSIRTEQAYLNWLLRLVAFSSFTEPSSYNENTLRAYLEYLVVSRGVSASTQAQALSAIVFFIKQCLVRRYLKIYSFLGLENPGVCPLFYPEMRLNAYLIICLIQVLC